MEKGGVSGDPQCGEGFRHHQQVEKVKFLEAQFTPNGVLFSVPSMSSTKIIPILEDST